MAFRADDAFRNRRHPPTYPWMRGRSAGKPRAVAQVRAEAASSYIVDHDTGELVERMTYLPFGGVDSDYRPARWDSFREDVRYTSHWDDSEVGLVYFGTRYYSPTLGRFISPDPLTIHGLIGNLNPYEYVYSSPMRYVDPFGLDISQNPTWVTMDPGAEGNPNNSSPATAAPPSPPVPDASQGGDSSSTSGNANDAATEKAAGAAADVAGGQSQETQVQSQAPMHASSQGQSAQTQGQASAGQGQSGQGHADPITSVINQLLHAFWQLPVLQPLGQAIWKAAGVPRLTVRDPKLTNIMKSLYKPGARVGNGSTADAIRSELATGKPVGGTFHSIKGRDSINALNNWLTGHPDASPEDIAAARAVLQDLTDALAGK